ncbi:hypothetical protein [Bacillus cereus group sp. FL121]|nr:type II toxin-antitoxin system Phd/YefM family antitoxin [Bacillus sp. FDAARGOS_527]KXI55347.1 hypothetical protein ACS45_02235 [Bacillus cereus]RXC11512.1 type II toxin-antitoxin system Phd/YefM family antitoxin [Escherichia coli]
MKVGIVMDKPKFSVDQIISASYASKRFGEVRKKAKALPQFISDNNKVDTVVLDYAQFEKLYMELSELQEIVRKMELMDRVHDLDENPQIAVNFQSILSKKEKEALQHYNPYEDDLFEED